MESTVAAVTPNCCCLYSSTGACLHGVLKPSCCSPPPSMTWGMSFWVWVFVWVLDRPCQTPGTHTLVVFSLHQQSPYPVPVHQTGSGAEWDHWAASTNLFPSAAWLISPVGAQLLLASGMHPPPLSEECLLGSAVLFFESWAVQLTSMSSIHI